MSDEFPELWSLSLSLSYMRLQAAYTDSKLFLYVRRISRTLVIIIVSKLFASLIANFFSMSDEFPELWSLSLSLSYMRLQAAYTDSKLFLYVRRISRTLVIILVSKLYATTSSVH